MIQPVAVIGAGPFGLSTAAHLRAHGIPVRVFGEPMVSWRDNMPAGMLLKSTPVASNIDAPQHGHTLADYCDAAGIRRLVTDEDLIPVDTFIAYGEWFQQRFVPELERVRVVSVDRGKGGGFELKLDSGELFAARAVVVASGLFGLAHLPAELAGAAVDGPTPTGPVSHSSQHPDLSRFKDKDLIVVGAGQSALEAAVLAAEAGARVRVVARGRGPWLSARPRGSSRGCAPSRRSGGPGRCGRSVTTRTPTGTCPPPPGTSWSAGCSGRSAPGGCASGSRGGLRCGRWRGWCDPVSSTGVRGSPSRDTTAVSRKCPPTMSSRRPGTASTSGRWGSSGMNSVRSWW